MGDMLRRDLAPLTAEAWAEIDETAARTLKVQLSARTLVDFDGPHGWAHAAVNTGRLDLSKSKSAKDVPWGLREAQPLVEARVPFHVDQMEMDNITRGCKDADLSSLEGAARKLAAFEETAIYQGFSDGQIKGVIASSGHDAVSLPSGADEYHRGVAEGMERLRMAGIGGPYALVLGHKQYAELMKAGKGSYPPRRMVRDAVEGGQILWSPVLDGGLLLSCRGGDFLMTVGQDIAVGYASHNRDKVELYLTESLTFQVFEPAAAVELKAKG